MSSESYSQTPFDLAVVEHSGAMLHYLYSLCQDWHLAEDLSQKLWMAVHRSFSEEEMKVKAFLYRKAKQVFIDHYRKTQCRPKTSHMDDILENTLVMPPRNEPQSDLEEGRLYVDFWKIFLPDEYDELAKIIFWKHARKGEKFTEIAEELKMAKSTVYDRYKKIVKACQVTLEQKQRKGMNYV